MSVEVLRCRVCETDYPALANGICSRCFGPLEPVYDWDEIARTVSRESIEAGPASLWRYAGLRPAALGMPAVIFCPAGLEPEKIQAATVYGARIYGVRGSYDDCSRLVSELAGEVHWGFVNVNLRSYYAEGSKTLAFETVEQLGWETPGAVICPIASGALFSKLWQGFRQFERLGFVGGPL